MKKTLSECIENLQINGRYSFTKKELLEFYSDNITLNVYLNRLEKKNRIKKICNGFYVIIPLEYQNAGLIPISWFIDKLMNFYEVSYYVGLVSAAALHGATHQQPQIFQVVAEKNIKTIILDRYKIQFHMKNYGWDDSFESKKTDTGYFKISSPELTALDLIRFFKQSGGMNNVVTIISELCEKITPDKLLKIVTKQNKILYVQRLGYILDYLEQSNLSDILYFWLKKQNYLYISFNSAKKKNGIKNKKWKIIINDDIEVDL